MSAAGRLRHRVVLETAQDTPDGQGGYVRTWSAWRNIWARVEPDEARARLEFGRVHDGVRQRMTTRWREGIVPGMRARLGERIFDIRSVYDPDETRRFLVLICKEA